MSSINRYLRGTVVVAGSLILSAVGFAQDPSQFPSRGGWPRAGDSTLNQGQLNPGPSAQPAYPDAQAPASGDARDQFGSPVGPGGSVPGAPAQAGPAPGGSFPAPGGPYPAAGGSYQGAPPPRTAAPVPAQVTIRPGTYVTVRVDQPLSSDRNQQGDPFSATLVRPVVVDGIVVAQSGQLVSGRVVEAQKAGRVEGVSRLRVQLTELGLVDGQQVPIQTELINRTGPTSTGRDAAAIGGTTALGAAIGAGAGAAAGIIGVLLTRGQPTIIYPESVLTFRIDSPVTIATDRAPEAFRYVDSTDYNRPYAQGPPPARPPAPYYGAAPYPYAYPYPYPYAYAYPYYYGPSFAFYYGRGFYGPRYYGHFRR